MARSIDAGGPLWVRAPDDEGAGVSVDARFETLDVERRSIVLAVSTGERDDDDGSLYATGEPTRLTCLLDTGECTPEEHAAVAFLTDHPWFERQLDRHMDHLRHRAWRAVAQRDRESSARRVVESAGADFMLAFHRLFPADWDLVFPDDGNVYWVVDQYCANPLCDCRSVALTLYRLGGAHAPLLVGEAQVDLSKARPTLDVSTEAARELFATFWADHEHRIQPRRDDARSAVVRYSPPSARPAPTLGASRPERNAPCPCGSGKKYKRCCLGVSSQSTTGVGNLRS